MPTEAAIANNAFGQPIGAALPSWTPRQPLSDEPMQGRFCRLERFDMDRHLEPLFAEYAQDDGRMWTYVPWARSPTPRRWRR
jgi:hypothetical protein